MERELIGMSTTWRASPAPVAAVIPAPMKEKESEENIMIKK